MSEEKVVIVDANVIVKPQGKGMAVAGFIISLVGLIFSSIIIAAVIVSVGLGGGMGLGYFWLVLCILGLVLSIMGMMKLKRTGGKRGLAIAGMIIGIVAVVWTSLGLAGVGAAASQVNDARMQMENNMRDMNLNN